MGGAFSRATPALDWQRGGVGAEAVGTPNYRLLLIRAAPWRVQGQRGLLEPQLDFVPF